MTVLDRIRQLYDSLPSDSTAVTITRANLAALPERDAQTGLRDRAGPRALRVCSFNRRERRSGHRRCQQAAPGRGRAAGHTELRPEYVHVRRYYYDNGHGKPGMGLAVRVDLLLIAALRSAVAEALAAGLLELEANELAGPEPPAASKREPAG